MDELERVRELYGEPQADPFLKARVFERLEAEPRRRRRRRLSWTLTVTGLATAVAVTVAVVVPGTTGSQAPAISGRSVLLAAATRAEADPATTGAYWRVRKLHRRTHPEPLGSGENRYRVVESWLTEQWATRDGRIWAGSRTLGARPESEADTEAWRRDGSPTEWTDAALSQDPSRNPSRDPSQDPSRDLPRDPSRGEGGALSASPGEGLLRAVTGRAAFSMAGHDMTFEQIRELPADPAALKDRVSGMVRGVRGGPDGGVLADALSGLLWSKPSSPEVRAAAYRALAELPNVRYLGTATDERGRKGAAFSFSVRTSPTVPAPVQRTLVIDVASSRVLSSTDTGGSGAVGDEVEVVLEAGWTDDKPAPPALP
ncbi:CU044_5270 family protein [Streptosporangium sp. G11]|uniref:CU044_5270 family protein n=1 Tax=Streptosporangium sp. G11 TaxID=3436926 RepID=UPI003EB6A817